jgi:hypothetical protein
MHSYKGKNWNNMPSYYCIPPVVALAIGAMIPMQFWAGDGHSRALAFVFPFIIFFVGWGWDKVSVKVPRLWAYMTDTVTGGTIAFFLYSFITVSCSVALASLLVLCQNLC